MINKHITNLTRLNKLLDKTIQSLSKLPYASQEQFLKELIRLNEVRESIASLMAQIDLNDMGSLGLSE